MEFMRKAQELAAELAREFHSDEMIFSAQMRRGDDWITLEIYRNSEDPHRLHAVMDFDTGGSVFLQSPQTIH